jgi:hypothetical protein
VTDKRGARGSGEGPTPTMSYVSKHDHPDLDVKAGQVFNSIEDVPTNITVLPVLKQPR